MIEASQRAGFDQELRPFLGTHGPLGMRELNGNWTFKFVVAGKVHPAETALTQQSLDAIAANALDAGDRIRWSIGRLHIFRVHRFESVRFVIHGRLRQTLSDSLCCDGEFLIRSCSIIR